MFIIANAVNEEDSERDRAPWRRPRADWRWHASSSCTYSGQYWSAWTQNQPNTSRCKPNRWVVSLDRDEFPLYGFVKPNNLRKI